MKIKSLDPEGEGDERDNTAYRLECALEDQAALCDALERIADRLPDRLGHGECLHLRRAIPPILAAVHQLEEEVIRLVMTACRRTLPGLPSIVEQIRYEQIEESCYAEELCDALTSYGIGRGKPSPETLGYMLRLYFDCARRRIRFDNAVLIPMLPGVPAIEQPTFSRNGPSTA